jgi:hypothetical protein
MGPNADADAESSADHNHWLAANIQEGGSFWAPRSGQLRHHSS